MTDALPGYNFSKAYSIESVAGAAIFAALYLPFLLLFIKQAVFRSAYIHVVMAFFCAVRIAAFILRALLAAVASDSQNLKLLIAFEIIYNAGFFGLLYSAYTLVLDRGRLSDVPLSDGPISKITRRATLFRIVLAVAVVIGISGAVRSATGDGENATSIGDTLRKTAIFMFFALCILVAFQTILLVRAIASYGAHKVPNGGFGATHGIHILCIISLLLLVREAFFAVTSNNVVRQNDENLWYPFAALTEFVAVVMFASPGLVPLREELPA